MEEMREAFEIVFGEDFLHEMARRLRIIGWSFFGALLFAVIAVVWKAVACGKIKKAILSLSEHPNEEQAALFVKKIGGMTPIGKLLAKLSVRYAGLSRGDCRAIYQTTILPSENISREHKKEIRNCLMKVGCRGLTDVDGIS